MKQIDILRLLSEIEMSLPVESWKILDVHVWPIIRNNLGYSLSLPQNKKKQTYTKGILIKKAIKILYTNLILCFFQSIADRGHNGKISEDAEVVFLVSSGQRTFFDGEWYIKQAYPIIKELQDNGVHVLNLEDISSGIYRTPRVEDSIFHSKTIRRAFGHLISKITVSKIYGQINLDEYSEFINILEKKNIRCEKYTINSIVTEILKLNSMRRYYRKIIKKANPKIGMIICYYGFAYDFILACNDCGIPTVDIQHGIAGDLHYAYSSWNNVPSSGYNTLPKYFFTWNKKDCDTIRKWSENCSNEAYDIGNTWLDMWKNPNIEKFIVKNNEIQKFINSKCRIFILFTHQPPYGFPDWLLKTMIENKNYFWGIRLHPRDVDDQAKLKRLLSSKKIDNIEYEFSSRQPLPLLLRNVDLHVTGWSATVLEAAEFNLKSIVTHEKGVENFADEIKNGKCLVALDRYSLIKSISSIRKNNHKMKFKKEDKIKKILHDLKILNNKNQL